MPVTGCCSCLAPVQRHVVGIHSRMIVLSARCLGDRPWSLMRDCRCCQLIWRFRSGHVWIGRPNRAPGDDDVSEIWLLMIACLPEYWVVKLEVAD